MSPGRKGPVITVDGPAGSGKSTTARAVAGRLGFRHLDSGALYRALTFALLESGVPPDAWPGLSLEELSVLDVDIHPAREGFQVRVDGRVVDEELRTRRVTDHVSQLATLPAVRRRLLSLQREAGRTSRLVADGRDMGTVVFPDADLKVFLVAELEERARRRLLEREGDEPTPEDVAEEAEAIAARDRRDSGRDISPLRRPDDAFVLDTTDLSFEEQVDAVVQRARALGGGSPTVDGPGGPI